MYGFISIWIVIIFASGVEYYTFNRIRIDIFGFSFFLFIFSIAIGIIPVLFFGNILGNAFKKEVEKLINN